MRNVFIIIALLTSKLVMSAIIPEVVYVTDTLPPPPVTPSAIVGDSNTCVNETVNYTADISVGCEANWYIDGVLQSSTTNELEVLWEESGSFLISLDLECDTNTFPVSTLLVIVVDTPAIPTSIQGVTNACTQFTEIYTTEVGDEEQCQWIVDGVIQIATTTTLSYYWDELGLHNIEVRAINDCGIGDATYLDVTVVNLPVVNLGNDTTILQGNTIELDASNSGSIYLWSTGEATQTITVSQSGNYAVTVSNGCGDVWDEITVDVIVSINEQNESTELIITVIGNNITIAISNINIEKVQIWDITGRLIINSISKPYYYLPKKGVYIVVVITKGGNIFTQRIVK